MPGEHPNVQRMVHDAARSGAPWHRTGLKTPWPAAA